MIATFFAVACAPGQTASFDAVDTETGAAGSFDAGLELELVSDFALTYLPAPTLSLSMEIASFSVDDAFYSVDGAAYSVDDALYYKETAVEMRTPWRPAYAWEISHAYTRECAFLPPPGWGV